MAKTALWQAVQQANPEMSDEDVDASLYRAVTMERDLVLNRGLNLDQAREIARADLFPENSETEEPTPL